MSWIESHQSLAGHPKTRRAARLLGVSVPTVIGHLHCLWYWALDYCPDGQLDGFTAEEIADGAMWDGDPEHFAQALTDCGYGKRPGFLERGDDGLRIHDWHDYAGKLIEKRKADAERKKAGRQPTESEPSNGRPSDIHRTAQVPTYLPTDTYQPTDNQPTHKPKEERDAPVDNELLDELLDRASLVRSSVAQWRPNKADRATFSALIARFPPQQLRDELAKFTAYTPQRDYKLFGKTFASWMGRVTPLPMTEDRPSAKRQRLANFKAQLEGGMDRELVQAMAGDEWQEVVQ